MKKNISGRLMTRILAPVLLVLVLFACACYVGINATSDGYLRSNAERSVHQAIAEVLRTGQPGTEKATAPKDHDPNTSPDSQNPANAADPSDSQNTDNAADPQNPVNQRNRTETSFEIQRVLVDADGTVATHTAGKKYSEEFETEILQLLEAGNLSGKPTEFSIAGRNYMVASCTVPEANKPTQQSNSSAQSNSAQQSNSAKKSNSAQQTNPACVCWAAQSGHTTRQHHHMAPCMKSACRKADGFGQTGNPSAAGTRWLCVAG